jgi:hypothetical protein
LPNLPKVLLGMVPKSPSSNMDQQGRLCWVLLWSYACVLTSLAVSIMLYWCCWQRMCACLLFWFSGFLASSVVCGDWAVCAITGLQRKLILVGPEKNEHFLFVATKSSLVSQLSTSGCVPMDCRGKEPCFRARERDPTPSGVTRATTHKELACDSKEGTCVATAFWQSSSSNIFNAGS